MKTTGVQLAAILLLAIGLAGCDPARDPADGAGSAPGAEAPAATSRIVLEPKGLGVRDAAGTTTPIAFGTAKLDVLAALAAAHDGTPGVQSANGDCGAGPLTFAGWDDGLTVAFDGGAFAGWSVGNSGPATEGGIGVGSPRAALQALNPTVDTSTLGTEFTATIPGGDLGGLLDGPTPEARVTTLWAGVTCMFR